MISFQTRNPSRSEELPIIKLNYKQANKESPCEYVLLQPVLEIKSLAGKCMIDGRILAP